MNCWRIRHNLVAPFLDGALDDGEQQAVAEHLDDCSECSVLVKGVASLPELPFRELGPELVGPIFADFERDLAERIQDSLSVIADSHGTQREDTAVSPTRSGLGALFGNSGGAFSPALVGAYIAVLALLTGGLAWHYMKVENLEASLEERKEEIGDLEDLLEVLGSQRARALAGFDLDPLSNPFPVFGSTTASGTLSISGMPTRMPASSLQGADNRRQPPLIQQVSVDNLDGMPLRR